MAFCCPIDPVFEDECFSHGKIVRIWAVRECDIDTFALTTDGGDCDNVTELPISGYDKIYRINFNADTATLVAPQTTDENKSKTYNAALSFTVQPNCKNIRALGGFQQNLAFVLEFANKEFKLFGFIPGTAFSNSSDGIQFQAATSYISVQYAINNLPANGEFLKPFLVTDYAGTVAYLEALQA